MGTAPTSRDAGAPEPYCHDGKPKQWADDPFDRFLPARAGFLQDFVFSLRGNEVPVAFSLWAAVLAVSSALKRETWLQWHPAPLYANFYCIIVAPAGVAKKGVAVDQYTWVLAHMQEYIQSYNVRVMKEMKVFEDKITGEGLAKFFKLHLRGGAYPLLDAEGKPLVDRNGAPIVYKRTGEVNLVAEELGTMLSRARYNEDLITTLTSMYNTKDESGELTVKRGRVRVPSLFTNFIGGTTPDAFRDSIPRSALNEGFLSRTIVCYQRSSAQCFPIPHPVGPPREELASRLAWIAENTSGPWTLDPAAYALYQKWYRGLSRNFDTRRFHPTARSRMPIHALKLALILCAQRYTRHLRRDSRAIDEEAMREAIALLEATLETAPPIIEEVEASPLGKLENRISHYLEDRRRVKRQTLMQNMHLTAGEVTQVVSDMVNGGKLEVWRKGERETRPHHDNGEEYRLPDGNGECEGED